jgi:hypothetical protein
MTANEDAAHDTSFSAVESENVVQDVTIAVDAIKEKLEELVFFHPNEETKISQLVQQAQNPEYLSHSDPAWYPWL